MALLRNSSLIVVAANANRLERRDRVYEIAGVSR